MDSNHLRLRQPQMLKAGVAWGHTDKAVDATQSLPNSYEWTLLATHPSVLP